MPYLTKTEILAGLQCPKRLWLERRSPESATVLSKVELHGMEVGNTVEAEARLAFPEGVVICPYCASKLPKGDS